MKSAIDEANSTHKTESEYSQNELTIYRKRLNEVQLSVAKWES